MAGEIGQKNSALKPSQDDPAFSDVARLLRDEPFAFRFYQAVWLVEQLHPQCNEVGGTAKPSSEVVRFSVYPSQVELDGLETAAPDGQEWRFHSRLAFPASEILEIDWRVRPPKMCVNFMGLTGPKGVLPQVYTELVEERINPPHRDYALRDFLDIFNHRVISLFYNAWKRSRLPVDIGRYRRCFMSLVGLGTEALENRQSVPDDAYVFFTGLFALQPRSAVSLEQILADYFRVPVDVEQFVGAWYPLRWDSTFHFEELEDPDVSLGTGVVVGDEVWDQQSRITIQLGPLTMKQYEEFLPGKAGHRRLRDIVRFFTRDEHGFDLRLVLLRQDVPPCDLLGDVRLGWTSWVNNRRQFPRDPGDTLLVMQ